MPRFADTVLFTGPIDRYYDYCYGRLDYQAVGFQDVYHANTDNFQGNAVINYPDADVPYTRSIEHRHSHAHEGQRHYRDLRVPLGFVSQRR